MIKSDEAYKKALEDLERAKEELEKLYSMLSRDGFTTEQIKKVTGMPYLNMKQLEDDIEEYKLYMEGNFDCDDFEGDLGRYLIACRIYRRMTQKELSEKLGVSPQQISRDERNEYRGATYEKLKNVAEILNVKIKFFTDKTYA